MIAVLPRRTRRDNAALRPIIDRLPVSLCASPKFATILKPLLPETIGAYYRYTGSLTTPPCDGGVIFFVLPDAMAIGVKQLKALHRFGHNAKTPPEPRNGREITRVIF